MRGPTTTVISSHPTHHLSASPWTAISHGGPETEPWWPRFGFWPKICPPVLHLQTCGPTAATIPCRLACHLSALHWTTVSHSKPETEPRRLHFGFWPKTCLPCLAFANMQPHHRHHLISPCCHSGLLVHKARLKQSHGGSVSTLWPEIHHPVHAPTTTTISST